MHENAIKHALSITMLMFKDSGRCCLHKYDLCGRRAWKKPLLSKKNIREKLQPASEHAGKERSSGNNVL